MFMFEANHQCIATITTYYAVPLSSASDFESRSGTSCLTSYCLVKQTTMKTSEGGVRQLRYESANAWNRCDPYRWWSMLHDQCAQHLAVQRVALTFDHSINGGPFYRIVNVPNICDVSYQPFTHNPWILVPPAAPVVGYPVQNYYRY